MEDKIIEEMAILEVSSNMEILAMEHKILKENIKISRTHIQTGTERLPTVPDQTKTKTNPTAKNALSANATTTYL